MKTKLYSTTPVPFDRALREYRAAHQAYVTGSIGNGKLRVADARAFENLSDARIREARPWSAADYR